MEGRGLGLAGTKDLATGTAPDSRSWVRSTVPFSGDGRTRRQNRIRRGIHHPPAARFLQDLRRAFFAVSLSPGTPNRVTLVVPLKVGSEVSAGAPEASATAVVWRME